MKYVVLLMSLLFATVALAEVPSKEYLRFHDDKKVGDWTVTGFNASKNPNQSLGICAANGKAGYGLIDIDLIKRIHSSKNTKAPDFYMMLGSLFMDQTRIPVNTPTRMTLKFEIDGKLVPSQFVLFNRIHPNIAVIMNITESEFWDEFDKAKVAGFYDSDDKLVFKFDTQNGLSAEMQRCINSYGGKREPYGPSKGGIDA